VTVTATSKAATTPDRLGRIAAACHRPVGGGYRQPTITAWLPESG